MRGRCVEALDAARGGAQAGRRGRGGAQAGRCAGGAARRRGGARLHERCGRFGQFAEKGGGVELGQLERGEVDLRNLRHLDRGEVGRSEAARIVLEGGCRLYHQRVGRQRGGEAREVGGIRQLEARQVGGIRQLEVRHVRYIGQLEAREVGRIRQLETRQIRRVGQLQVRKVGHLQAGEVRCLSRASDHLERLEMWLEGEALRRGQARPRRRPLSRSATLTLGHSHTRPHLDAGEVGRSE